MIQLSLPCEMNALAEMNARLDEFIGSSIKDEKLAYQLRLTLEELFVNFVVHGGNPEGTFEVTVASNADELRLKVSDEGLPFDPLARAEVETDIGLEDRTEGGLGLHFVKSLSRKVEYKRVQGRNVLKILLSVPQ